MNNQYYIMYYRLNKTLYPVGPVIAPSKLDAINMMFEHLEVNEQFRIWMLTLSGFNTIEKYNCVPMSVEGLQGLQEAANAPILFWTNREEV